MVLDILQPLLHLIFVFAQWCGLTRELEPRIFRAFANTFFVKDQVVTFLWMVKFQDLTVFIFCCKTSITVNAKRHGPKLQPFILCLTIDDPHCGPLARTQRLRVLSLTRFLKCRTLSTNRTGFPLHLGAQISLLVRPHPIVNLKCIGEVIRVLPTRGENSDPIEPVSRLERRDIINNIAIEVPRALVSLLLPFLFRSALVFERFTLSLCLIFHRSSPRFSC